MEIINVSEIKSLVIKAQTALSVALHALNTKILIGEINHPETPAEKKPRKKRTRKVKMDLEKEYQTERHEPLSLPDGDVGSTFYTPKKKKEKKEPTVE